MVLSDPDFRRQCCGLTPLDEVAGHVRGCTSDRHGDGTLNVYILIDDGDEIVGTVTQRDAGEFLQLWNLDPRPIIASRLLYLIQPVNSEPQSTNRH